jgi:two-component system capsular synthesis response regulator RcsB
MFNMIKKVLIAEDHQSVNLSLQKTLEELAIVDVNNVYYCDDALEKIQKALQAGLSYDLLITDLFFEEDGKPQKLPDGKALITAVREVQPDLKVLVFSANAEPVTIDMLFQKLRIDGYVRKARNDAKELKQAIDLLNRNQRYFPRHLMQLVNKKNAHDFTPFDITIIQLLAQGMRQKDIPAYLQQQQIQPSGLSTIEKRLNQMKTAFGFFTNEQLVAYCKDMHIL